MRDSTRIKFNMLLADLLAKYAQGKDYVVCSRKQIHGMYETSAGRYPTASYLTKNKDYRISKGRILVTLRDDVHSLRDSLCLSGTPKISAIKLAKCLMEDDITQRDIDDAFGGNDINDILAVM